jgi:hypothetical protein
VPRQVIDPLDDAGRLARVEVGADLASEPVGQAQPRRGQGVGGGPQPLGQVEVVDRAVEVIGRAASRGPRHQLPRPLAAEADRVMVVGHVGPTGQGERLVVAAGPRGLLGLSQDNAPMSQHGRLAARVGHGRST